MPRIEFDSDEFYRFGNILVEPAAHRLERDGRPLPVEPKAYTLLLTLLRHAGELVSKDTLLDSVWGHHHVTTGVLNRVVSQLRHTLGDSSAQPRYIATVHSLGYRFIGELQRTPLPRLPAQAATTSERAVAARTPHRRLTDGDQFLNYIDLQPCLNQLANWAALLPPSDSLRRAILAVLGMEQARLRESGVAPPALVYQEAVLAALEGDRQTAIDALGRTIDEGFRDELALRHDLAWRPFADDAEFHRLQQRLDALLVAERALPNPPSTR